jgi:GNAT superfamily N-acetyltransferase
VARYSRINPTTAEVAFVVEDTYQHRGVGHHLMERLRAIALANGITAFVAEVLPGNTAMLRLLREAGETQVHPQAGEWQVRVDLTRTPG